LISQNNFTDKVSLKGVVIDAKLQIAYIEGRSYGEEIDRQMKLYKDQMIAIKGDYGALRLRTIFEQGKVDGIIEYTAAFSNDYYGAKSSMQISVHKIIAAKDFVYGYIVCSNSANGKKAIEIFNKGISNIIFQKFIVKEHLRAFPVMEGKLLNQALTEKWR
jgi:uncharacterized protein (TIGR02285 family)